MRLKLDENLPTRLADTLQELGCDVHTVMSEGLVGRADEQIWLAAQAEGRILITQDLDFSDMGRYKPGTHAGLLLVRLHNPGREALLRRVVEVVRSIGPEVLTGSFAVATETKIRIHPPPQDSTDQLS